LPQCRCWPFKNGAIRVTIRFEVATKRNATAAGRPVQAEHVYQPGSWRGADCDSLFSLSLAAICVVSGEIDTSPHYSFREAMKATGAAHCGESAADVLGPLSLIT
jgi:hypothetical protein